MIVVAMVIGKGPDWNADALKAELENSQLGVKVVRSSEKFGK